MKVSPTQGTIRINPCLSLLKLHPHEKVPNVNVPYKEWRMNWERYLLSPHWRELKLEKFRRSEKRCFNCMSTKKIECHHIRYREFTDCTPEDLIVLCEGCHYTLHAVLKRNKLPIESVTEENILDFLDGEERKTRRKSNRIKRKKFSKRVNRLIHQNFKKVTLEGVKALIVELQLVVDEEESISHLVKVMSFASSDAIIPAERIPF